MKTFFQRADIFLLVMCIICSLFGIAAIHKAVTGMAVGGWSGMENPTKFIVVQVFSMFLGIGMFVIFTVIDSDLLGEQWKALCVINVLLIIALVLLGQDDGTGNKSWIRFAGIGIQPSEVIKVLYIVVSAKQMTYLKEYKDINSFMSVVQMAGHFVVVFGMIVVVSGDLGSAAILISVFLVMFFGYFGPVTIKPKTTYGWAWQNTYYTYGYLAGTIEATSLMADPVIEPENYSDDAAVTAAAMAFVTPPVLDMLKRSLRAAQRA